MTNRIALITGANRGIGYEACRQLAKMGLHVILTSRDASRGQKAADQLRGQGGEITFHALDVTIPESITELRDFVRREFGRLDVLVNNAAVYLDEGVSVFNLDMETMRATIETNLYGPLLMCQAFVPMMRQQNYGRVVNVSSGAGALSDLGGGTAAYAISKAGLNALTRIVASEVRGRNIKINAMCPGWVRTEMGGAGAPRSVEEGADTLVWLATLPDDGPTNGFFRDRKPIAW